MLVGAPWEENRKTFINKGPTQIIFQNQRLRAETYIYGVINGDFGNIHSGKLVKKTLLFAQK